MSRCFPYPPPEYAKSGARGSEGSIGAIKLQKEKTKPDSDRRKDRKRQRKEEKELHMNHAGSKRLKDEKTISYPSACVVNLSDDSSRSGISEEHDIPVPETQFCVSDGIESNKRVNVDAPGPSVTKIGNKLRIRFTVKPRSESQTEEAQCSTSTSGTPVSSCTHTGTGVQVPQFSAVNLKLTRRVSNATTSATNETVLINDPKLKLGSGNSELKVGKTDAPAKQTTREPTIDSLYKALVQDWSAPVIAAVRDVPDDEDWLFGEKTVPRGLETASSAALTFPSKTGDLWPHSVFIPGAEIFALPYTVPF